MKELLAQALERLGIYRNATTEADTARDELAASCAAMQAGGMSTTQVAMALGIHRSEAQRLIERGRA